MYQQQGNMYANDGATKISRPGAGGGMPMNGNNGYGAGGGAADSSNGGFGSGYGMGGYGGAAGYGGSTYGAPNEMGNTSAYGFAPGGADGAQGQTSMYGGGSMYGPGAGALAIMNGGGDPNDTNVIVTKLFSSRRDLDRLASTAEFSRRFDSNWGSYRSAGADGYGGSIYGPNPGAAAGSLMSFGASRNGGPGTGAAGLGPDGAASAVEEVAPRVKKSPPPAKPPSDSVATETAEEKAAPVREVPPKALSSVSKEAPKPAPKPIKTTEIVSPQPTTSSRAIPVKPVEAPAKAPVKAPVKAVPPPQPPQPVQVAKPEELPKSVPPPSALSATQNAKPAAVAPQGTDLDDIPLLAEDLRPRKAALPTLVAAEQEPPTAKVPTPRAPTLITKEEQRPRETAAATVAIPPPTAPPKAATPPPPQQQPQEKAPTPASAAEAAKPAETARPVRPRSRPPTRPQSRLTAMSDVEFPKADEVKDEMVKDGLADPEKDAALNTAREEQRRQRDESMRLARLERARQRQAQEDLQKQHDEEARRARDAKAEEERQKRELLAKMDAESRKERAAARERQREEEKRRFEEAKRAEDEKEAARAAAAIAERRRQQEAEEAAAAQKAAEERPRPTSRPRSRRPVSRPSSNLRGAIPEQPPDVVAGNIEDNLAEDQIGKPKQQPTRRGTTPMRDVNASPASRPTNSTDGRPTRGAERATPRDVGAPANGRTSYEPTPVSQPSRNSKGSAQPSVPTSTTTQKPQPTPTPTPKQQPTPTPKPQPTPTPKPQPTPTAVRASPAAAAVAATPTPTSAAPVKEANIVKTFVLVEAMRRSNHALRTTEDSVSYKNHTVKVTEVKTREEDNFNYNSTVVHDVREAACKGFNAAVLSMDTVNSAGRFDSPVWSILNRIVRTLLVENANDEGRLRDDFELTCAMGYLYRDKVKDLLAPEGEAQFAKVAVNPSPIYGPRLTNLKYDAVTDPMRFEEVLSATLSQGAQDATIASLTEGAVAAFVLVKQVRETDGKPDIYLSSLVVASAGEDPLPYQSAISHTRNEYATVFHLVLGGPSCTCFMLNIGDDDTVRKSGDPAQQTVPESVETAVGVLEQMATLQNYDLRSGSVKRFIKYVERSHANAKERLAKEQDESQRRKVSRYLKEQERLLEDAYNLLKEANINIDDEL